MSWFLSKSGDKPDLVWILMWSNLDWNKINKLPLLCRLPKFFFRMFISLKLFVWHLIVKKNLVRNQSAEKNRLLIKTVESGLVGKKEQWENGISVITVGHGSAFLWKAALFTPLWILTIFLDSFHTVRNDVRKWTSSLMQSSSFLSPINFKMIKAVKTAISLKCNYLNFFLMFNILVILA